MPQTTHHPTKMSFLMVPQSKSISFRRLLKCICHSNYLYLVSRALYQRIALVDTDGVLISFPNLAYVYPFPIALTLAAVAARVGASPQESSLRISCTKRKRCYEYSGRYPHHAMIAFLTPYDYDLPSVQICLRTWCSVCGRGGVFSFYGIKQKPA